MCTRIVCRLMVLTGLAWAIGISSAYAMSAEETLAEKQESSRENALAGLRRGDSQSSEALLRGTFYANQATDDTSTEVAGYLVTQERTYQLKTANERVRSELLKRKGQRVALEGEIRNRGKYFIAQRFAAALPPPVALRNRNGL